MLITVFDRESENLLEIFEIVKSLVVYLYIFIIKCVLLITLRKNKLGRTVEERAFGNYTKKVIKEDRRGTMYSAD